MHLSVSMLILIALPAMLSFYCAGSIAALRPRADSLEWIAACDRPAPPLLGGAFPFNPSDLLMMGIVVAASGFVWTFGRLRPLSFYLSMPTLDLCVVLLENVVAPMAAVGFACILCKRLFGGSGAAALAALVMSADLISSPLALFFSAAGLFFLVRFLTGREEAEFSELLPDLIGCFAALAAGCYFDQALLLVLGAALVACLAGCYVRFARSDHFLWLYSGVLFGALTAALVFLLIFIPAGKKEGFSAPELFFNADYYRFVYRRLAGGVHTLYGGWRQINLNRLRYDWFLLLSAVPALLASIVWIFRGQDRRGALITLWAAAQSLALGLLGSHAVALSCAVSVCAVWARLESNRRLWLAVLGAAGLLVVLLAQYVFALAGFTLF